MSNCVYDAAVLVAADRNDRNTWADHKVRLESGALPIVPATVLAQVSRSPQQVQLRRFLAGCIIVPFTEHDAHAAGRLLAKAKSTDTVDASVVAVAVAHKAIILTGDATDIRRLARASGHALTIVRV